MASARCFRWSQIETAREVLAGVVGLALLTGCTGNRREAAVDLGMGIGPNTPCGRSHDHRLLRRDQIHSLIAPSHANARLALAQAVPCCHGAHPSFGFLRLGDNPELFLDTPAPLMSWQAPAILRGPTLPVPMAWLSSYGRTLSRRGRRIAVVSRPYATVTLVANNDETRYLAAGISLVSGPMSRSAFGSGINVGLPVGGPMPAEVSDQTEWTIVDENPRRQRALETAAAPGGGRRR
jgi:hypothetical protein